MSLFIHHTNNKEKFFKKCLTSCLTNAFLRDMKSNEVIRGSRTHQKYCKPTNHPIFLIYFFTTMGKQEAKINNEKHGVARTKNVIYKSLGKIFDSIMMIRIKNQRKNAGNSLRFKFLSGNVCASYDRFQIFEECAVVMYCYGMTYLIMEKYLLLR